MTEGGFEKLDEEQTKQQTDLKAVHIKQSRREVCQIYKNMYIFYDKKIEEVIGKGKTILDVVREKIPQCYGAKLSKEIKQISDHIGTIKNPQGIRKQDAPINENEFLRLFSTDHIIGAAQIAMKKLQEGKNQVIQEFKFMPIDFLYPIFNKKDQSHHTTPNIQQRIEEMRNLEMHTYGITLGYKIDGREIMIETPLEPERNFLIL